MNQAITFFKRQVRHYIPRTYNTSDGLYISRLYESFDKDITEDEFLKYPIELQTWIMNNEYNFKKRLQITAFPYNENTKKYLATKKQYTTTMQAIQQLLVTNFNLKFKEVTEILENEGFKFTNKTAESSYTLTRSFIRFYREYATFEYVENLPLLTTLRALIIREPDEESGYYLDCLENLGYRFAFKSTLKVIYNVKSLLKIIKEAEEI